MPCNIEKKYIYLSVGSKVIKETKNDLDGLDWPSS